MKIPKEISTEEGTYVIVKGHYRIKDKKKKQRRWVGCGSGECFRPNYEEHCIDCPYNEYPEYGHKYIIDEDEEEDYDEDDNL